MEPKQFCWADYVVFGGMLGISCVIGLYHGLVPSAKNASHKHFLTGGGHMSTFPVALSMLASFVSSTTLMGQPSEVYLYGPQLWLFGIASIVTIPVVGYVMIPFFREKNYYSANQYFGERYSRGLQLIASTLLSIMMVVYMAIVLYGPALALHQVTGIDPILVVSAMYVVCIIYTTVGGIKAVVWTDAFQVVVLFFAMFSVLIKGTYDLGGLDVIWQRNALYNRTNFFNWDVDPTERYSVWTVFIGAGCLHLATYGGNQLIVQRYLAVGSTQEARRMLWINVIGWTLIVLLTTYTGMLIFAAYSECDPIKAQKVTKPDQLFPLFIMDTMQSYPGFPGVFICGIFSAGLSTVSTGVNSLAAIWFAELEDTKFRKGLSENAARFLVKGLAFGFGVFCYLVVFAVPYMGNIVPFSITLTAIATGSIFGLFILGIFFKKANTLGAGLGVLMSIICLSWIALGNLMSVKNGQAVNVPLRTSVNGCEVNTTLLPQPSGEMEQAPTFYRLSYMWYCPGAIAITVLVGVFTSLLSGCFHDKDKSSYFTRRAELKVGQLLLNETRIKPSIVK